MSEYQSMLLKVPAPGQRAYTLVFSILSHPQPLLWFLVSTPEKTVSQFVQCIDIPATTTSSQIPALTLSEFIG